MVATGASGQPLDRPHAYPPHHEPDSKDVPVIHLVPSLSLNGRFSARDLPAAVQLPLLNSMVVPRIVSWSMTPTFQPGDRLELSPPDSLTIGAIVVFRHDTMLVCHRINAIDPQGTLTTSGDATLGACEIVQPGAVIGMVTGVLREGIYMSLERGSHPASAAAQPTGLTRRIRAVILQLFTRSLRALVKASFFQPMLARLLRWTTTVAVLAPAPLRALSSHSTIATFTLRKTPHRDRLLAALNGQKSARFVVRLGPWQLAQYDPTTKFLLLRQCLQQAGLEPFVRDIFDGAHTASK